jgi:hypothetical protein
LENISDWWFWPKDAPRTCRIRRAIHSFRRGMERMAEKLDPKEMVSFEELLMRNVYILGSSRYQALFFNLGSWYPREMTS